MPVSGKFYTQQELVALLGVTKQRVHNLAQEYSFVDVSPGLYQAQEVDTYLKLRQRTELYKLLGQSIYGLIKDESKDIACPVCHKFAILIDDKWICEDGHGA